MPKQLLDNEIKNSIGVIKENLNKGKKLRLWVNKNGSLGICVVNTKKIK